MFDSDSNCQISTEEISIWMMRHGKLMTPQQIEHRISSSDKNNDGVIDRDEFVQIVTKKILLSQLVENNYA